MSNLYPIATIVLTKLLAQLPEGFLNGLDIQTLKIGAEKAVIKINGIDHAKLVKQIEESLGCELNIITDGQDEPSGVEMNHITCLYDDLFISIDNEIEYTIEFEKNDNSLFDNIIDSYFKKNFMILKDPSVEVLKTIDGFTFGVIGDVNETIINRRISHFADSEYYEDIYDEKGVVEINVNGVVEKFTKTGDNKATISIKF